MADESKLEDLPSNREAADEVIAEGSNSIDAHAESEEEDDHEETAATGDVSATAAKGKKKKSKRKKIKEALTGKLSTSDAKPDEKDITKALSGLSNAQLKELLSMNPALASQLGVTDSSMTSSQATDAMKKLNLQDIMTGLAAGGKNAKDIGSYKFWQTQPVPKFDDKKEAIVEGPFKIIDPERVRKEPDPLPESFEWVTVDLTNEGEMTEVWKLLTNHYVEDEESMFRFAYSLSFLRWALLCPGWKKEWHVGVRSKEGKKPLVGFISAVPVTLRIRKATLKASEVNFLCIHKKLRSRRLAPVLIKEVTRRCYLLGVYQALYTGGVVLPTPVSTCRYFHRSLDWQKLYEVGFSHLPPRSKPSYQVAKFKLPEHTDTKGLRAMQIKDVDAVLDLLKRYLARYDMAQIYTKEEVQHWLFHDETEKVSGKEQVIWSYVVEDPITKKITDYFSFYSLQSTVIGNSSHKFVNAAYLYYYATEAGVPFAQNPTKENKEALSKRLNALIHDALILAKKYNFDVFNAVSIMENALFLEEQKFGKGDGQLHYYLYNYNANHIAGGVDRSNELDTEGLSGVGVTML